MFLAVTLKNLCYFLRLLFLNILRTRCAKNHSGYYKKLLAQQVTKSTLRVLIAQGKPCRCLHVPYGD